MSRFQRALIQVTSECYSGSFGLEGITAEIVVTKLKATPSHNNKEKCRLVFVVDTSCSMAGDRITVVKSGLLAMRDVICGVKDIVEETQEPAYDIAFRKHIECHIITFSDYAKHMWDSTKTSLTFTNAVSSIEPDGSTNLEAGILLARDLVSSRPTMPTWIVCMTDGEANRGNVNKVYFGSLFNSFGKWCNTICLGIGDRFSDELLDGSNHLVHVKDTTTIYETIGTIVSEVRSTLAVDTKIKYPSYFNNNMFRVTVGADSIGFFNASQEYTEICIPFGDSFLKGFDSSKRVGDRDHVDVVFTCLDGNTDVVPCIIERKSGDLPPELMRMYFESASARLIKEINQKDMSKEKAESIRSKLSLWKVSVAIPYKASVEDVLTKFLSGTLTSTDNYNSQSITKCVAQQKAYNSVPEMACVAKRDDAEACTQQVRGMANRYNGGRFGDKF